MKSECIQRTKRIGLTSILLDNTLTGIAGALHSQSHQSLLRLGYFTLLTSSGRVNKV